jgi:hypothetical protein
MTRSLTKEEEQVEKNKKLRRRRRRERPFGLVQPGEADAPPHGRKDLGSTLEPVIYETSPQHVHITERMF